MADSMTNAQWKQATVTSISHKKGVTRIVVEAPTSEESVVSGEIADLTSGLFLGTVVIKGKQSQLSLDFAPKVEE